MWPGFMDLEDGLGSASGDWTVRLVSTPKPERPVSLAFWKPPYIEVVAASTGKPYAARIMGRDTTYGWKREFLKFKWEYPSKVANPSGAVRLVLPVSAVGVLPAALEVRWGPATGGAWFDKEKNTSGRLCAFRGLFILDVAGLRQVEERHVAMMLDEGIVAPGPPKRPADMRAKIRFDEEV